MPTDQASEESAGMTRYTTAHGLSNAQSPTCRFAAVLVATFLLALAVPSVADAAKSISGFIGGPSVGSSQPGFGGFFNQPRDVAVYEGVDGDTATDKIFTVEAVVGGENHRVQRFDRDGTFERMWGKNIDASNPSTGFEVCTVAASCQVPASAATATGSLKGEFGNPMGVAVDQANAWVYVYDRDNRRIQKFDLDGNFLLMFGRDVNQTAVNAAAPQAQRDVCTQASGDVCQAAVTGAGAGQLATTTQLGIRGLAVRPGAGNVFVADPTNRRVLEYQQDGSFVRGWGFGVDTGAAQFQVCTTASTCQAANAAGLANGQLSNNSPLGLAVDSQGVVYATDAASGASAQRIVRFDADLAPTEPGPPFPDSSAALLGLINPTGAGGPLLATTTATNGLKVDLDSDGAGSDEESLLALRDPNTPTTANTIVQELDIPTEGAELPADAVTVTDTHSFAAQSVNGLGVNGGSGNVFLAISLVAVNFPSCGCGTAAGLIALNDAVAMEATATPPTTVTATTADLAGSVNAGEGVAKYQFQVAKGGGAFTNVGSAGYISGSTDRPVSTTATGLAPSTIYRSRIVVRRFTSLTAPVESVTTTDALFVTGVSGPDAVTHEPASISATEATLAGEVNPNGSLTDYSFSYGLDLAYTSETQPKTAGEGTDYQPASDDIDSLEPGFVYHNQVCATNPHGDDCGQDVDFPTRPLVSAGAGREYELVSPSDKISGVGAGSYASGDLGGGSPGLASDGGDRYIVHSTAGAMLLDSAQAYANDYAFADRTSTGWISHSPFTHANPGSSNNRYAYVRAASDDLSTLLWSSNGGNFRVFEEQEAMGTNVGIPLLSDWGGAWEIFGPTTTAQSNNDSDIGNPQAVSADGGFAVQSTRMRGLAGPDDPTLDLPSAASPGCPSPCPTAYIKDVSDGLSDTYPGDGPVEPIGVCDDGTQIPSVDDSGTPAGPSGSFSQAFANYLTGDTVIFPLGPVSPFPKVGHTASGPGIPVGTTVVAVNPDAGANGSFTLSTPTTGPGTFAEITGGQNTAALVDDVIETRSCPDPVEYAPGEFRSDALIDLRGVSFGGHQGSDAPLENLISEDGSRVFFMSPSAGSGPVDAACEGSAATTQCPTQLYVRVEDADGDVATRWVSRSEVAGQNPSLMSSAVFEGASANGDKVFFRTRSPLTMDDPNGLGAATPGGVMSGAPSPNSWDLYVYDFTDDSSDDPGEGSLTRLSAGPSGAADSQVSGPIFGSPAGGQAGLRFVSADGERGYFVTSVPLPGVGTSSNGTITSPSGTASSADGRNLYMFDLAKPAAQRWRFVARLPVPTNNDTAIDGCATTIAAHGRGLLASNSTNDGLAASTPGNCMTGTSDGRFIAFAVRSRLLGSDLDDSSVDIYAFDAVRDELTRITAPDEGPGGTYLCASSPIIVSCNGDTGIGTFSALYTRSRPGVTSGACGSRVFFQSKGRLVPGDVDDHYDVYEWCSGELNLVSRGTTSPAYYAGGSADGEDVFIMTRDRLSWQDVDSVMDVYDAKAGGGIEAPPQPPNICEVLAGGCQSPTSGRAPTAPVTDGPGGSGNSPPVERASLRFAPMSAKARLKAAKSGVLSVRVRSSKAGNVRLAARARIAGRSRKVAAGSRRVKAGRSMGVRLRLSKVARRRLASGRPLTVAVTATMSGAHGASIDVVLKRGRR
jgi:sugar lactone lactonase YvrE